LRIYRGPRYDKPWPVGHLRKRTTTGAFGHRDMVLGVWEWTGEPGFHPFVEPAAFMRARQELFRYGLFADRTRREVRAVLEFVPLWRDDKVVCKGGMYASTKADLRIGTRAPLEVTQTMSAVGFRLAKTPRPGLDFAAGRILLDGVARRLPAGRRPDLAAQVGIERYVYGNDDRVLGGYCCVSLVPLTATGPGGRTGSPEPSLDRAARARTPVALLFLTHRLVEPRLDPGSHVIRLKDRRTLAFADAAGNDRAAIPFVSLGAGSAPGAELATVSALEEARGREMLRFEFPVRIGSQGGGDPLRIRMDVIPEKIRHDDLRWSGR
jgi:hypothetical protein